MTIELSENVIDAIADAIVNKMQKPKMGRWMKSEMSIDGIDGIKVMGHTCSKCKYYFAYMVKFNYCPNCGAKMVEPQEREDEK